MNEYPRRENKKMFFLLSLLLHLLLLFICFLFISYHNSDKSVPNKDINAQKDALSGPSAPPASVNKKQDGPPEPPLSEQERQELAEMKARQSSFGAPVVFEDMPEIQPSDATSDQTDDTGTHQQDTVTEAQADFKAKQPEPEEKMAPRPEPKKTVTPDPSPDAQPTQLPSEKGSLITAKEILEYTIAALENLEPVKQTQEQLQTKKPTSPRRPAPKSKKKTTVNKGDAKRSAGPVDKKFSFADLANGFLENLERGGQDSINQRGNPNIRPSIEQLKQSSYKQKMAWNLQAAFKRAARTTKFYVPCPQQNRLECVFHITKAGELEKLEVVSSTGHQELDSYIVRTIKDAFPLPPIPDHWQQDMLVQSWVFRNIQPNESSYVVNF